jgi:hypothetical protein
VTLFRRKPKREPTDPVLLTYDELLRIGAERSSNMPATAAPSTTDPDPLLATWHCPECDAALEVRRSDREPWRRHTHGPRTAEQAAKDARRNQALAARAGVVVAPVEDPRCEVCGQAKPGPGALAFIPGPPGGSGSYVDAGFLEHTCPGKPPLPHDAVAAQFQKEGIAQLLGSTNPPETGGTPPLSVPRSRRVAGRK